MKTLLISDGMQKKALNKLQEMGYNIVEKKLDKKGLSEEIKNADAVIVRSATKIDAEIIDSAMETGKLKIIIRAGVGVDNIDLVYTEKKGISVFNTPDASSQAVAELTIAHMLSLARYLFISNVTMRNGEWNKKEYEGMEIGGKTLGIIGFGRIGKETAKRAHALGMRVVYTCRSGRIPGYDQYEYLTLEKLLKEADFVSLHLPYSKEAGCVLSKNEFQIMKKGTSIINTSRGALIDHSALLDALNDGTVDKAALDVFDKEPVEDSRILKHPRISMSPHIGASTIEAQDRIGSEIIKIIYNFFEKRNS